LTQLINERVNKSYKELNEEIDNGFENELINLTNYFDIVRKYKDNKSKEMLEISNYK
jgi:hypothetical protein